MELFGCYFITVTVYFIATIQCMQESALETELAISVSQLRLVSMIVLLEPTKVISSTSSSVSIALIPSAASTTSEIVILS